MVNAPSTPGVYEWQAALGTWMPLTPYEVVGGALAGQLAVDLTQIAPNAPTAPYALTSPSHTDTSISVTWEEGPDSTVGGHRIYLGGVKYGADLAAGARSATISGLTQSTQYKITVTRFNSTGQESGPSNVLTVTTSATQAGVPTAPTGLVQTTLADTSWAGSWSETADASVLRHWRYLDGVRYGAALSATATSATWSGLTAGTNHTVYVTRENAAGESAPSNALAFKTTGGGGTVQHDPVMGVPDNNQANTLRIQSWPAARVYDFSGAQGTVTKWGCRVIGLTDSATSPQGGQASANAVKNFLEGFYYTSSGAPQNSNVEIHFGHGNEIAKDAGYTSGTLPPAFIETYRLTRIAIDTLNSDGTKRYPMASLWVDMTAYQIKANGAGPRFKAIAPYLDGMACSVYPPGRQSQPPVFTPYADYAGLVMDVIEDWHSTYPNCKAFATWEVGIPIDHANQAGQVKVLPNGEPTAQTNITIRPRYLTGGVDSAGTDWLGLLQYIYNRCDAMGVAMREQLYWNQQSNVVIPNRLLHDQQPRTSPDTETAWHNWTPGTRLAHG